MAAPFQKFVTERTQYHEVYANSIGQIYELIANGKNQVTPKENPAAKTICILNLMASYAILGEKLTDNGKELGAREKALQLEKVDIYELYYEMMKEMYQAGLVAVERRRSSLDRVIPESVVPGKK